MNISARRWIPSRRCRSPSGNGNDPRDIARQRWHRLAADEAAAAREAGMVLVAQAFERVSMAALAGSGSIDFGTALIRRHNRRIGAVTAITPPVLTLSPRLTALCIHRDS